MRYLVATDGSAESDRAVRYAARHALAFDATLDVVHVLTPETELVDGKVVVPGEESAIEQGEQILDRARELVAEVEAGTGSKLTVETALLTGRAADALAEHARATDAAAIYVGHRGVSADRDRVGSVAKSVLDKATVPVTIIR